MGKAAKEPVRDVGINVAAAGKEEQQKQEEKQKEAQEDEDDEDDEPKLKYSRLTKSLGGVYRNGDAVSCTWVGGDKMV